MVNAIERLFVEATPSTKEALLILGFFVGAVALSLFTYIALLVYQATLEAWVQRKQGYPPARPPRTDRDILSAELDRLGEMLAENQINSEVYSRMHADLLNRLAGSKSE